MRTLILCGALLLAVPGCEILDNWLLPQSEAPAEPGGEPTDGPSKAEDAVEDVIGTVVTTGIGGPRAAAAGGAIMAAVMALAKGYTFLRRRVFKKKPDQPTS